MSEHRFERMLPWQLREEVARRPVAYVPLGTYEWHGEHLPVGLDALTSHGICQRAAEKDGGICLPALHYGTGGGHGHYTWSMMMPKAAEIEAQIAFTMQRLNTFGIKLVVLFSGHFPPEQLDMIDRLAASAPSGLKAIALSVNRIEGLTIGPDHAALFETTLLAALHRELVQLERLPKTPVPANDEDFGEIRHDPKHPLYGIFGPDPRRFKEADAAPLFAASVEWTISQVQKSLAP